MTADRTLMADYKLLFDGMLAASQTTATPPALISRLLMPWVRNADFRARVAPLGLRRIEAALLRSGFSRDEVVIVDENHLGDAIGPATKVVAVASGEPSGKGMNSSTMTEIAGGSIYPEAMFRRLLKKIKHHIAASAPSAKLVLGGPGAWQLADNPERMHSLGFDHVVTGYAEGNAAEIFRALLDEQHLPKVIPGEPTSAEGVPSIQGSSTMGVVEISRGCGLGCSFCTIAPVPMIHIPESTVIADARKNVESGMSSIAVLSEDFFRYGAKGMTADPEVVISLLTCLRRIDGLRLIQTDHANISSIAQYSDEQLKTVRDLLVGDTRARYPWVNVGIETASGELLAANGGVPKMRGCSPDRWSDHTLMHLRRLCEAGFLPMASLVVGLPGEREGDILRTLDWVESLQRERITIFPVLYAPIDGTPGIRARDLSPLHWRLIKTCYKLNFRWIPRMYWDNQTAAGVCPGRRVILQTMGLGQVVQWNALFAWHSWRSRR